MGLVIPGPVRSRNSGHRVWPSVGRKLSIFDHAHKRDRQALGGRCWRGAHAAAPSETVRTIAPWTPTDQMSAHGRKVVLLESASPATLHHNAPRSPVVLEPFRALGAILPRAICNGSLGRRDLFRPVPRVQSSLKQRSGIPKDGFHLP